MTLLAEKPETQNTCVCGKFMPEGQMFCFNCWLELPATIAYKLLDSDPGRRSLARLDAEADIRHRSERNGLRHVGPHPAVPQGRAPIDRKTASTGER